MDCLTLDCHTSCALVWKDTVDDDSTSVCTPGAIHGRVGRGVGTAGGATHSHAINLPHIAGLNQRAGRSARQSGRASIRHLRSAADNRGLGFHWFNNNDSSK